MKRLAIILGVVNTILLGVPGLITGLVYLVKVLIKMNEVSLKRDVLLGGVIAIIVYVATLGNIVWFVIISNYRKVIEFLGFDHIITENEEL